jgi:hypothetical protein
MDNLKKFAPKPDALDAQLDAAPAPVKGAFGGATWLNNAAYPLVKPEHAQELEQNAAVNEFGKKMPRAQAEADAYKGYKERQHVEAAAHHLAGMQAARGAGDMEAARKHGLMYNLHSKAIGHEPVGPAHPDVVAHMNAGPSKVYKFKAHHGDQLALTPEGSGEPASAPAPALGKSEVEALNVVHAACQALLAKAEDDHKKKVVSKELSQHRSLFFAKLDCGHTVTVDANPKTRDAEKLPCVHCSGLVKDPSEKTKKGEMSPRAKGARPCICTAYKFPHRHKSGACAAGK